jgi:hypothetical protein
LVTGKRKEADKSPMQFYRKAVLFLTIDLAEDLLDLLLAPIAVDVHFQHAGLRILEEQRTRSHQSGKTNKIAAGRGTWEEAQVKRKAELPPCPIEMAAGTRNNIVECL